jgi:L-seryl-tRNA(Ser) seleniumtransferase
MDALKELPSVDRVLRALRETHGLPHPVIVAEIRAVLAEQRERVIAGGEAALEMEPLVAQRLAKLANPSLRRVINATGVILHTNLGRAPLAAFQPIPGYSNLEYDLAAGKRGKRDTHTAHLLERLLGRPAILVNNNAAAVFLALHELAAGQEVIVSRGELIEIGDGFRIPEIMSRSGAILREVGTTNKTNLSDYRDALNAQTRLIMRVHPSNFRVTGFTARPSLNELADLGRTVGIPVYEDLGSGCLTDLRAHGIEEPLVAESVAAGVNLLSFSCDKLLGGPQTGIIAGDAELVARVRRNPMYRAFRVDKLIVQALETTLRALLRQDWQAIPALRMILANTDELRKRAERVCAALEWNATALASESPIGGGSTPDQVLPTWVVAIEVANPNSFEKRLRLADPPIIARIEKNRIVLDMRTVADSEIDALIARVNGETSHLAPGPTEP